MMEVVSLAIKSVFHAKMKKKSDKEETELFKKSQKILVVLVIGQG